MSTRLSIASLGLVVLWSSGFIGAHLAAQVGWVTTLTWRFIVASLILVPICLAARIRVPRGEIAAQLRIGLFGQVIYLTGVFLAIDRGVASGTAALVASLQPLVVAAIAGRLLGEHTTGWQRIGLLLGLIGVALVVAHDLSGNAPLWAYGIVVLSMLSLATSTIIARRQRHGVHLLASLTIQSVLTAVVYVVASAVTGQLMPSGDGQFWVAVGWLVVLSTFGGYGCYQYVVRHGSATMASTLLYLTPPTTMLWAWLMFGDALGWLSVVGLVTCAAGVVLATRPISSRRASPPAAPAPSQPRPRPQPSADGGSTGP
ncbi:EamA family transporter [Epidermidibacterium keratini]|uniref:EamA family transporter n=1 Tax=Epidermidibacterium keratini TaxID=1891644 RepID=A0A7L4YNA4_9ACTN|nr:DMT family transporter [Epidermidibacterium keratini]QHC00558.1 EamA family transporter [Epidermidibacterium keratini]